MPLTFGSIANSMPKPLESGGIPLPPSWPPFNRDMWDDRAYSLLDSLSRMGHEEEDYASIPAAINGNKGALARAARDREESSIGLAKLNVKKDDRGAEKAEQEEEGEMKLTIKQTKVLKTYEQRRKFIVKAMDMHRHTIGGGRSGRRGRAECTSFFRRVLEILDDQYEEALRAEGVGNDEETGPKGQYTKSEDYGSAEEDESSGEGEEDEEEEDHDEEEAEEALEEDGVQVKPKKEKRKGPGRPRKSETLEKATSPNKMNKLKIENPKSKVVVNEQDFFDQHNDLCEVCNKPGEVLCCATCNLVYHVNCLRPKLKGNPPDDWSCAYCISDGVLGGKKDGNDRRKAAQACREMEQMRRDVKEREQTMMAGGINMNEAKADGDKKPAAIDTSGGGGFDGARATLEDAAESGCRKCVKELETGIKTRKEHDDICPRKFKSVGNPGIFSPRFATLSAPARVKREEEEQQLKTGEKKSEEVTIDADEPPVKRRKVGRPPAKKPGRPPAPATDDHPISSPIEDHPLSLEQGAAAGCDKCLTELETGEKTRNGHSNECPLKFRGGRPLPGILSPASTDAINARQQQKLVVEESKGKVAASPGRSARLSCTSPPDETEVSPFVADMAESNAAAMSRKGRPTKASLDSANHETAVPLKPGRKPKLVAKRGPGRPKAAIEPAFEAESTDAETSHPRRGKRTRLDSTSAYLGEDAAIKDEREEEESAAILGEFAEETAKQHEGNKYGDGEQLAKTLRGGGEISDASMKLKWSEEEVTADVLTSSAVELESAVGIPATNRGLEDLAVHSMLGYEMSDLTYSNNGRVQRSCHDVTDSLWTSEGHTAKAATGKECGELEHMRGGGRPKKDTATSPAEKSPAITAPKRGRPPTKQTKREGSPKKNQKRAPIKKETNTSVEGVGILNRMPSTLFDCPACLDLSKIKICCYCACRICFNKFGKEQTMLCDTCDQEYHTFCLGLDCIPEGGWECPACSEYEEKKAMMEQKKKEREAKKKLEEEKRKEEDVKKEIAAAKRRVAYQERKKQEEEKKRTVNEQKRLITEKRKSREAELRAQGLWKEKPTPLPAAMPLHKRGPGRPPKAETMAKMQAQYYQQQDVGQPLKRGRGRPRKDGKFPIPRKLPSKMEISMANLYYDHEESDEPVERSRSGRKIHRPTFHDDMEGGGLMYRQRSDEHGVAASASRQASMYLAQRSASSAAKSNSALSSKKEPRRKPGARECMQMSRKFNTTVIDEKYFDVLIDYSKRAKVDHLIRMRERMDEHSRFLEAQLAGLEALVKEKGEYTGKVPVAAKKTNY